MRKEDKGGGMMKRLTNSIDYCQLHCDFGKSNECFFQDKSKCYEKNIYEKLREYENLEEQGLMLRLPCKEGNMVYLICSRYSECSKYKERLDEYNCQGCEEDECDSHKEYYIHINHSVSIEWIVRNLNNFGKTVFLTKAEAEQKLKEMESD